MDIARIVTIAVVFGISFLYYRRVTKPSGAEPAPGAAEALGFLPQSRQNTLLAYPAPDLERALAATAGGGWEPAARLMAATRESRDWARRAACADALGSVAGKGADEWLCAWEEAVGADDPDVALVRLEATVALAWHLRGGGWAKDTSREQFEGFHNALARARVEIARAKSLDTEDPTPYVSEIRTALGFGLPHETMHRIWKEVTARDPYHYVAHGAALQYWCAKWRGSEELATSFARDAAAGAPPGSLLAVLPLRAWWEHQGNGAKAADYCTPHVMALTDAALADVAAAPPDRPETAEVRHFLAYTLTRQGRYEAALEQFRLVDGYVNGMPWGYYDDPAEAYCHFRERAARGARRG